MLTGGEPCAGETVSDTMAAVLRAGPQWDAIPLGMRRLVRRCLEKNPKRRLRDIGDVWRLLDETPASSRLDAQVIGAAPAIEPSRMKWLWPTVAALLLLTTGALGVVHLLETPPPVKHMPVEFSRPPRTPPKMFNVAPDGRNGFIT